MHRAVGKEAFTVGQGLDTSVYILCVLIEGKASTRKIWSRDCEAKRAFRGHVHASFWSREHSLPKEDRWCSAGFKSKPSGTSLPLTQLPRPNCFLYLKIQQSVGTRINLRAEWRDLPAPRQRVVRFDVLRTSRRMEISAWHWGGVPELCSVYMYKICILLFGFHYIML